MYCVIDLARGATWMADIAPLKPISEPARNHSQAAGKNLYIPE
jgi:hypothetical protein